MYTKLKRSGILQSHSHHYRCAYGLRKWAKYNISVKRMKACHLLPLPFHPKSHTAHVCRIFFLFLSLRWLCCAWTSPISFPHYTPVIHIKVNIWRGIFGVTSECYPSLANSFGSIRFGLSFIHTISLLTVKHLGNETLTHLLHHSSSNTLSNIPQNVLVGFVDFRLSLAVCVNGYSMSSILCLNIIHIMLAQK